MTLDFVGHQLLYKMQLQKPLMTHIVLIAKFISKENLQAEKEQYRESPSSHSGSVGLGFMTKALQEIK